MRPERRAAGNKEVCAEAMRAHVPDCMPVCWLIYWCRLRRFLLCLCQRSAVIPNLATAGESGAT